MILAIDPGGTSGIAVRMKNGDLQTCTTKTKVELYEVLDWPGIEQIVFEDFGAEIISKYGIYTVQLIGAIEHAAYVRKIGLKRHMPMYRRPFLVNAKQALAGRKYVVHELDATAHLLRFEYDQRNRVGER